MEMGYFDDRQGFIGKVWKSRLNPVNPTVFLEGSQNALGRDIKKMQKHISSAGLTHVYLPATLAMKSQIDYNDYIGSKPRQSSVSCFTLKGGEFLTHLGYIIFFDPVFNLDASEISKMLPR